MTARTTPLRVATFNLLSGRSVHDGRVVPERLREAVAALDVDVLALQEVDRGQERSGGADQLAAAASAMGAAAAAFAPTLHGVPGPGRAWQVADGEALVWPGDAATPAAAGPPSYGVGLASRLPVLAWRVRRFPAARGALPLAVPGPGGRPRLIVVPEEPRVALAAVVRTPDGPVTVVSTHLSFIPPAAVRQLRAVTRWAAAMPGPRLLLGDLNLPGPVAARLTGWVRLGRQPTFPSPAPRLQLDHALGHGWPVDLVTEASAPAAPLSDHRPLVLRLH